MEERTVDVAIIGAGTAGLGARREVERAGKRSVLIEAGPYGTTCARVGCMPSKLLIAAADAAHAMRRAPVFGVHPGEVRVDGAAVLERLRAERDRFVAGVVRKTEGIPEAERLKGRARFLDATTLQVDDHIRVSAGAIVVATGSRPWVPPPFDQLEAGAVETSEDVFEWRDLPQSVAVVGTGIIGLEIGQALARLGVEVSFFNPFDELGPFTDPKLKAAAKEIFDTELDLHVGIEDVAAERVDGGVRVAWTEGGARRERTFERVLAAAGRRPSLASLDLERAGLSLDDGCPEWDPRTCQCGDAPIFLAGDVSGHRPLLHEASDEGHIAGENAARFPDVTPHVRRTPLAIAFTHPQIGVVGCAHAGLPARSAIGEVSYADQGRARVQAENAGLVRLYADATDCTLIGAEMLGPDVEHLAHLVAWAVQREMTVQDAISMPFYHPVVEEGLRTALRALGQELDILGSCRGEDLTEAPGA